MKTNIDNMETFHSSGVYHSGVATTSQHKYLDKLNIMKTNIDNMETFHSHFCLDSKIVVPQWSGHNLSTQILRQTQHYEDQY